MSGPVRTAALAATGLSLALLLAACASPTPLPSASMTPSPQPSVSTTTPAPEPTLSGAATTPVSRPPGDGGFGLLTSVRLAGHPGYDRFVLEFRDAVPGYQVSYVSGSPTADPSGDLVEVEGSAVLWIRLEPASGWDLVGEPDGPAYTGPGRVTGDTVLVKEAVRTGDFEAVLSWVLGVDGEAPFVVTELTGPPRLVVDVATSG